MRPEMLVCMLLSYVAYLRVSTRQAEEGLAWLRRRRRYGHSFGKDVGPRADSVRR
jgi:hypothetical protein